MIKSVDNLDQITNTMSGDLPIYSTVTAVQNKCERQY